MFFCKYLKTQIAVVLILVSPFNLKATPVEYLKPSSTFIVIAVKPENLENKSAKLLSTWLKNIYGTATGFSVVKENVVKSTGDEILISVGKTKFSISTPLDNLEPYSFSIKRNNKIISIEGATPMGTLLATNYFLDHYCGVRFYLPGDLFTSMPEDKRVALKQYISITEVPFTRYLSATGFRNNDEYNWGQNNGFVRKDWESHQHSMGLRFYNDTIFKMFPEIFPIINGNRYFPKTKMDQNWEPDFAEPKLVNAAVYASIQYFKQHPQIDYISFSVQDSKIYPTEGKMGDFLKNYPNTRQGRYRGYTDAFVLFLNRLAKRLEKELPENGITAPKTIVYLVYGNVHLVPLEKLNSNILPVTVYHIAESLMDSLTKNDGLLDQWSRVTNRIGNHDWAGGKGFIYPRIYTNLVSAFLRHIQKDKMSFDFAHLELYPNWSLDGPKDYFMSKIYWNPVVNTDSLLSMFCDDMFGKASNQMRKYFSSLEDLNTSMNNDPKRNRRIGVYETQLALNENELSLLHNARRYIDDAYSIAQTDEEKKRIGFFSDGLKISEGFFEIYNSKQEDPNKADELKNYLKDTVAGNKMMLSIAGEANFLSTMNSLIDKIVKKKAAGK